MGYDRIDSMYDALVSDGAQIGTRQQFKKLMLAPGKEGYRNRLGFYQAMKQDGANIGATYEDFGRALGLHAVNPKPQQQKPVQPVKKQTMKQRAQEVAAQYQKSRQQKAQQPRTTTTSGTDYMQNWKLMHMRNDQMNPMQQAQASNARARMQRAQEQAERQEQQRATPISRSRITPTAKNFNETMQQLSTPEARQARAKQQREDDARALAQYEVEGNKFVRNDGQSEGILGNDLLSLVDSSMNEAQELTRQQYQQNLDKMGGIYAPQSVKEQAFRDAQTQEQVNRQNVLMNNLSKKIGEIYSQKGMQRHIAESAERLNMGVEEYVDKYVTPEIMNYAQKALTMRNQEEIMPHGALDYIAKNLSNSIIGMMVAPSVMSRDTRQRLQEGIAIADGDAEIQKVAGHKDETYRSGIGTRFASTAVNMAADSGPLAVIGAGASAAVNAGTRVLTNGLVKAGVMKAAQKLTAQQMAFKVANMTTAQKIMSGLGTRTATGALNLAGYSGVTAALSQASTGDDTSLQAIGEAGLKGAEHGAVTGAMFGVSGAVMAPWVSKFGITGLEKSTGERLLHGAQKFGATAAGLGVEAGTMMVADNVTGDKDISFGTWLEDVVMVGAFKAGEPSNFVKMGNILHHLTHNSGGNFVIGKNANGSPIAVDIRLTPDEKNELISSASGKNLMDAFVKVDRASKTAPRDPKYKTAYTDFMNDPDVSQSTKEKVNAAMGLFNTTRGRSYRSVNDVKNKQILEYTKNNTLLTRTSYKNADERRAILYKQKLYRDNDDMFSLIGYSKMKDMQLTDEDGNVTSLALGFLKENGYDENKDITDPKNAQLINDLRNPKSALYLDWEKYVDKNGLYGYLKAGSTEVAGGFLNAMKEIINDKGQMIVDIDKIMQKDPMKRTDEENRIFYHVKRALEDELFPSWRPHADQSASQGKTVAEENKLGTDNPEGGVVVDELRNLHNAEQAVDEAMESNDVFKQVFEKLHQQGLTPAQIYDALIQNGLTEEELTPLAQYINANARVQGMQQATADAIEENVKSFVSDWSYHGTLNGQAMNGEQALYVQDSNGRTLLVGSGDVAFDQTTGRAKEGSGDMLVCFDPNTREMVYVKADEVTLFQNQPIDQFSAEYRQRLQMKNSEPYNQAAQEQAMQDAAKAQQKQGTANISENTGSEPRPQNEPKNEISSENQEVNGGREPGAEEPRPQPQPTRKFADGSDVPMATDSKGRPTPDYEKMTPEQSAEILTEDFGENAEKVVDGQIQKAEKALKDAEKMKVDYTAEPNDIMEQETLKNQTIEAAKKQLDHAQNIKKAMTAKKVAETVGKTEQTEGAHEAGSVAAQKFVNAPRLVGNKRTRMLADGETKIRGHYEIVPAESLTPSHDVNNGYKKSEGFPTDAEGRTVNDRDYEHDKAAQQNTDQIARKYNGMAIEQVPVVSDEGIVYDGNGRTMAGQKAAKEGTDAEYINDLLENAENFGFTREQIEQSGIEHPRLVLVTDERLPYDAATFAKFNRNEKKTQSNTEQAVAKAKSLTSDEVGAIVAEIEGNGSLDAFFNNSKAINDLVKTLVDKGIIGQNEVAQMMDSPERLSAQGREYVKNLLLGSIFKPETIRMLGIDSTVKNKAINAIRSVMDNMKLGDYSLRDEIDQAIQLLYEARQGGNKVDTLLRTPDMFGEDAAKRYSSISQMMALALEGKVSDFRDLLDEYNRIAAARNTGEGSIFEATPTKEELINEYLNFKKWQDYGTGHSEIEGSNDVSGIEEHQQEASGGNEPAEAERPRVEEADDLENKELESRIEVTDEGTETPSKNGPIMKQKIFIDGDKEVIKVDEPNDKGEYTGSYYEYDGKKFGDLNEVVEHIDEANADKLTDVETDWQNKIDDYIAEHYPHHNGVRSRTPEEQAAYDAETEAMKNDSVLAQMRKDAENAYKEAEGGLPLLPKEEKPDPQFNPIEAAAAEFKKEHPLTEDEIMKADVDDLSKDMALDYLNGEVTDDLHRAIYESIYAKRKGLKADPKVETPKAEPSADPMEAFKNAAEAFEKEKKAKAKAETEKKPQQKADDAAVAASNKKVNDLWDMLKNAGKDEMSASFIGLNSRQLEVLPKLVSAMAENAYLRIKRGMHNLEDVVKEMRKEFAPAAKLFKKEDVDAIYEQMMNIRYRDGEQRMSLKEWADYYEKTSPKHQENLVGDSKTAEERKMAEKKFIDTVNIKLGFKHKFNGIVELRQIAEKVGLKDIKDTDLQELAETAIVKRARGIASSESTNNAEKFKRIKALYENQPSLNQRDSERVMKQQYSTPAPYAFLADMYVKGNGKVIESALEPSAGNGMLTIGLPKDKVHVNDIDDTRLLNLNRQGFKNVTSQDGTQPFADKDVDVVVTNPPFGSATPKEYDGYKISSLEGQMAINALESMKDDGRAAIIIGGKTEYAKNGSLNPKDKAFLGYLYSHYNVEDVINVDGGLYAKQGTSYPTRIILINGRRNYDPEHKVFPPVEKDARAEAVKDYDELYKRIEDDILRERGLQREPLELSDRERNFDVPGDSLRQKERGGNGVTNNKEHGSGPDGGVSDLGTGGSDERPMGETERTPSEHMGDNSELESGRDSDFGADRGTGSASSRLDNGGRVPEGSVARNANETSNERGAGGDRKQQGGQGRSSSSVQRTVPTREGNGLGVKKEESPKRELSTEKVKYVPQSNNPFSLNSVIPADQARATKKALEKIGDVDNFLVDELGYNDADDMHHALASEQADSVALAIHQAKQGNAFIIGDMTGIGKGRQAAAMIRFAYKQGKIPVFITAKKALFSDMYRDLKSIGNSDLRPFIWAAKDKEHSADMTDSEGKLVYQLPSDKEQERVMDYLQKNGKLPDGYDYIVTTYDSFSSGTMDYEDGKKTVRKNGKGSKNGQRKRDVLEAIAKNANVIMDESHKAGGQGSGSAYLQYVVPKLNAITFLSATYAKRPDNMPIYALRTSMNQAGMKPSELIDAIKRGGATLQEVMSQALTASGQFIRRERDMTGVTIDWKTIDDPVVVEEQREQYDSIISLFNDIIHFQRTYVGAYLDKRNDELAAIQASIKNRQGTKDLGIHNQPFASRTYNMVQQVLLSLKAREAAKSAIEHLKNGEKVVIALNNTNESQTEQYEANAEMEAPDLGVVLMKGLQGVLRYDQTDDMGNKTFGTFNLEDLGPDAVARYHEIEDNIKNASTGLSLSPIDVVRDELEAAGYRVGELTGRKTMFVKNPNGTVSKVKRTDTDKKKLALDFNTNKIDALILNRSASTGISLHDSVEYDVEHKPRTMIVVQQQPDVNEEVQMRGRIDRTGQVNRGRYEYIVSQIPSEQRLLMMFKAKLKSLDANTTSSQKSKFNDMEVSDIINKYGDKVVREYMAEHLDLYSKMADPFGWESSFGEDLSTIDPQRLIVTSGGKLGGKEAGADASKLLGRMALLRVSEQEKMLQEIGELYANEIQRLNEMGENDLEITELPLKTKTIRKEVWKQGAEPGGDNAFADNTYIEKVNMAILKKPMKAAEVKASQEGLTGGKTWEEYKAEKKTAVKEYFDQKIADETQRYEERAVKVATKAKEKYIKDAKKGQKDSGMSDEQIEKMAGYQYDNIYKQEKDKLNDVVKNLKAKAEMFERVLDTFDTNETFVLPTDMNNPNELSGFGNSYGRLIDIKITDNFSPNASTVSFATLDGRRKITFPIAGNVGSGENKVDVIGSIDRMTKQAAGMGDNHIKVLNQDLNNWDRLTSNESRKDGYIVTGNLMQALVDSKDQGLGGQLVKYTTDTGEVKTGILMPDYFDPKGLTTDAPINSVADKFELSSWHGGIDEVTSSDGEVKVKRIDNNRGNYYELRVPKSKAKGGKYFLDNDLLKLVNGNNFETRGNNMLAEFKPEQLKPVLDRLSKMGVKVQEERKTSEDEGTHFREDRGLQYSKTDTKDVKNSRIIPEDVDKTVSSQIEKKFDDRVDELSKDLSDEDKAEFNRHLDYYTSEFSRYKASEITYTLNGLENEVRFWERTFGNREKASRTHLVQLKRAELEAAETAARREMDYREVRAKALADGYGLRRGAKASFADISRLFEATNQAKEEGTRRLFEKACDIAKRLGVEFGGKDEGDERGNVGEATPERNINLFIDTLSRTYTNPKEAAHTILHELIHQATMGAIHLVKDGKAEGMLTPKQIEAVKTVIDIYNKAKADRRIVWEKGNRRDYGAKDEYEFAAEMAGEKQRKILSIPFGERIMNAAKELRNRGDNSLWQAIKNAWHRLFEVSDKSKMDKALNDIMDDFNEKIDDIAMNDIEENGYAYRVTDKDELDRLNKEKTFRMYSGMQEVDGKLYSPMAAIIDGKRTDATEIGAWMGADERPDLVKNGKFQLVKTDKNPGAGEGPVPAAYNPYMHTSTSVMNDQFSGAYARGNIKVVEWEIPESEKTSGYHAEGAKNSVGLVPWTSGTVNSLLPKDRQRSVMLSRWRKAVRMLPDEEVAEKIADQLRGTGLAIPWNVVTPSQLRELVKLGVPITTVEQGIQNPETKEKFLKQMAELEQEFPQAKFVNVKMTKDAYKEWGKNGGTKFRTDHGDGNYPTSSVESHVEKVAQKTGGKVNMVSSVDEITNKAAKDAIEEGRKITGWYDEKTGEVHLYMPNIHDRYTAEKTIWHEVVGHKGMRELFGDERFDKFLRDVWYDLDKPENAALKKLVDEERKYNPLNIYDAIEEGIARLAEDGKGEAGFWNGIKNKVSDFLHEIGYRIAPNTKDVKYLLWLAKNYSKHPESDGYFAIRRNALLHKLERDNTPSIVERNGMYFDNDGKNHDYLLDLNHKDFEEATDGKVHFRTSPMTASKIEEYDKVLGTKLYAFKESTLNHLQALEEAMKIESGEKDVWKDIPSAFNPLQAANRMDSVCQQISAKYDSDITEPLAASFKRMVSVIDGKNKDEQKRNAELYMITKHGLERNRVLYVRDAIRDLQKDETTRVDAERLQRDWNATFKDLGDKLDDGTIRFDQFVEKMDEWIRHNIDEDYDSEAHDYSGLTAIKKERGKNDPDYSCVDDVMNTEDKMGKELVKEYWKNKTAATDFVIDQEYYNGFKDSAERNHLKSMFKFYIPLRKFDETTAEDIYGYITEKGDPSNYIGSVIANAKGRESLSDVNVLAQISAMAKTSILNGGKNVVKQHLLRFTQTYANGNNGNRIFLEINPWVEKHTIDGKEVWEEVTPQIPENATQEQISNIVQNFESSMQAKKENGEAKLYNRRGSLGVRFQKASDKDQHIVEVYVAGKKRLLFCQGNPRAAQAVNGLIKDSGALKTWAAKNSAKINRFCARANTSYNIDFMFSNLTRDLTVATANVTKEGPKYTRDFCMGYLDNLTSFRKGKEGNYWSMFSRYKKNKLDMKNDRERMFKEFMDNGGQTGFIEIKKLEDMMKEYDNLIKKGNMEGDPKAWAAIKNGANFIEVANELFENIARYSCYVTSRKAGRSIGRSIYDAKEISGNFNKHGSGDAIKKLKTAKDNKSDVIFRNALGWFNSYMKNHTMFYNAGVQGASLFARNFKRNAVGTSMVFGVIPFALGIAQALINQYRISNEDEKERGGIEDPYAELPEWKRRNNICIYWGKGKFKTIPIGIELRAFFGLGDIAMGQSIYPGLKSDTPVGYDILGQMAQLVPASDFLGHHSPSGGTAESLTDLGLAAAPTVLKPELELIANRDWTGRPIYRGGDYLDYAPRWKRAYDSTSGVFMDINKWANMTFNDFPDPTEDMKGNDAADFITAPYIYQHLLEGYFGGLGSMTSRISKTGYKAITGNFDEIDPNQIPLYRVFNYKPSEGYDMQRTKSKWYNYSDELKQTEYNINQLKTNTPDVLKNIENNAKKFNFTHGKEGKAYNIWNAADSYIQKKKRQLKKVSDPEVIKAINEDINRKMQEAVNDLDKLN